MKNLVKRVKGMKPHIVQEYEKLCDAHNEASGENRAGLPSLFEKGDREEELVWKFSCSYGIVLEDESSLPWEENLPKFDSPSEAKGESTRVMSSAAWKWA